MINETEELIKTYAMLISQDEQRERSEIHHQLCFALGFAHDDFKPFEDITRIPTYHEALKDIRFVIEHHKPKSTKLMNQKPHLHCGCCQIPITNFEEFNKHILTPEHQRNVIEAVDTMMSDGHAAPYIKDMEEKIKNKEPVEFTIWTVLWKLKKENQIMLQLNDVMDRVQEIKETLN